MKPLQLPGIGILLLGCLAAVPAWADYGVIQTSGGQTYQGAIQPTDGGFTVAGSNGVTQVKLAQLARLQFQANPSTSLSNAPHGLRGTYFNNSDCSGERVSRIDPKIDFNWRDEAPIPGIGPVVFSVRWEGKIQAPSTGKYTFYAQCEGVKLWIDNKLLMDHSEEVPAGDTGGTIQLQEGKLYNIKMELYNRNLTAVARLFWSGPMGVGGPVPQEALYAIPMDPSEGSQIPRKGLLGLYYNASDFSGVPIPRYDAELDFDWGEDAPVDGLNAGDFCVRWQGKLLPQSSEPYTFKIVSQGGARVWLNGNLIIDAWKPEPISVSSVPVRLRANEKCDLRVEMYTAEGAAAKIQLLWSAPSISEALIPSAQLMPAPAPEGTHHPNQPSTFPSGVKLANGSFVACPIQSADQSSVTFLGPNGTAPVSLVHVAQIIFQELKPEYSVKLVAGRTGLLLKDKDFVEGEFKGIVDGQIQINSVLFGLKSYPLAEAMALVLHDLKPTPVRYEVRLRNGSVLHAKNLQVANGAILAEDSLLQSCKLAPTEVLELARNE